MYKWLITIAVILLSAGFLIALPYQPKTALTWDAPTTNVDGSPLTDLKSFKIYYSQASGVYTDTDSKDVGNVTTINIQQTFGQLKGTYYFVATAIDDSLNESPFSNEVSANLRKQSSPPANMVIQ